MSILKIKDSSGIWQAIRTLKGDKGDHGDPVDVRINGQSILDAETAVADIPKATNNSLGLVYCSDGRGLRIGSDGNLEVNASSSSDIDTRKTTKTSIMPSNLDYAVKCALADGKGIAYTEAERKAVRERIGLGWEVIFDQTFTEEVGITTWTQLSKNYKKFLAISFPNSNGIVSTGYSYVQLSPRESTNYGVANVVFGNASNKSAIGFTDVEYGFGVRVFNGAELGNTAQVGGITYDPIEASFFRLYVNGGNKIAVGARVLFLGSM